MKRSEFANVLRDIAREANRLADRYWSGCGGYDGEDNDTSFDRMIGRVTPDHGIVQGASAEFNNAVNMLRHGLAADDMHTMHESDKELWWLKAGIADILGAVVYWHSQGEEGLDVLEHTEISI